MKQKQPVRFSSDNMAMFLAVLDQGSCSAAVPARSTTAKFYDVADRAAASAIRSITQPAAHWPKVAVTLTTEP